jgi:hypothetical protein
MALWFDRGDVRDGVMWATAAVFSSDMAVKLFCGCSGSAFRGILNFDWGTFCVCFVSNGVGDGLGAIGRESARLLFSSTGESRRNSRSFGAPR